VAWRIWSDLKQRSHRRPNNAADGGRQSRGVALIAVLWLSLLLAVIAGSLIVTTRTELRLSRNLLESARAEALADGGVYLAIPHLLDSDATRLWHADGIEHQVELAAGTLKITVTDATARVDVNAASPELLAGLFRAAGTTPDDADMLAARIVDWRDADDTASPNGAEQADYDSMGADILVGNAPFLTPDEILRVPGMSMALYTRIESAVTVWSGQAGIDPFGASRLVLLALPGIGEADADAMLAARKNAENDQRNWEILTLLPTEARAFLGRGGGRMIYVRAQADTREGGVFIREAVLELQPGANPPFTTYAWRQAMYLAAEPQP